MTTFIGLKAGERLAVVAIDPSLKPTHPIALPGDPWWPKPPAGPVDPGYSPPWAIVGEPKPPVDPGYSPPWATLPIEPPTEPPPVEPPPPQSPGHWVWAYCPQLGRWIWVRVPGEGEAGPKKK